MSKATPPLDQLAALTAGINAYSDEGAQAKATLHRAGRSFLNVLAKDLGLAKGEYDVRSNLGGIAVSGEVTLHSDQLYVQLSESSAGPGRVLVLYRSCKGRKDYSGGPNAFTDAHSLANGAYPGFLARCQTLIDAAPSPALAISSQRP